MNPKRVELCIKKRFLLIFFSLYQMIVKTYIQFMKKNLIVFPTKSSTLCTQKKTAVHFVTKKSPYT